MKKIRIGSTAVFFLAAVCSTCVVLAQPEHILRRQLIGQWRNLTLHLKVVDASKPTEISVLDYNEHNWEDSLHIRPIHTFFKEDGSFYSEYYTLKDSLFYRPSGKWVLEGNRLTFYYLKPKVDTMQFSLAIKGDTATFQGMVDWSGDGKKDDEYTGTQRRQ